MAKKNKTKDNFGITNKKVKKENSSLAVAKSINWVFWLGIILLLTIITYIPLKDAGFVNYDDPGYVTENPYISAISLENIKTILLAGINNQYPKGIANNYHPITIFSLMCNYAISEMDASSYHWTNLIFHLINTVLSYFFFLLLFGKDKKFICIVGAALFALHPMHVESVAWISERKDLLFMMFYLLGMNSYIKHKKSKQSSMVYVYLFFIFSLLSKPAAVTFPLALLLIDYLLAFPRNWKNQWRKIPLFALSIIFGLITIHIQSDMAVGELDRFSFLEKISMASYGLEHYIKQFFIPFQCSVFHPYPTPDQLPTFIKFAPLLILVLTVIISYWGRKNKWIIFSALFFVINLALTLQFIQVGASLVSNRYTYLPYHGLIIFIIYNVDKYFLSPSSKFYNFKKVALGIISLWILLLSFKSYKQVQVWKSSETLWNNTLKIFPNSAYAYKGRGDYYMDHNKPEKAIIDFEKASKVYDSDTELLNRIGNLKRKQGDYAAALKIINKSIAIDPNYANSYNNRANVYMKLNKLDLAYADYQKCLQIDNKHEGSLVNLGTYYFNTNNYPKAIETFSTAMISYPNKSEILINRAAAYYYSKNYKAAIADIDKYLSFGNPVGQAYFIKSLALEDSGNYKEALTTIEKAISIKQSPQYIESKKRLLGL